MDVGVVVGFRALLTPLAWPPAPRSLCPCPSLPFTRHAGLTFSRGRKMTGSERVRPGLRKMGWGTTVKKNLVLGGLWEGAKE